MPSQEAEQGAGVAAKQVAEHASTLARLELELALLEVKRKVVALGIGNAANLRGKLPLIAASALGAGFVVAGGVGATVRFVARRARR